jgi:hypothetical protein
MRAVTAADESGIIKSTQPSSALPEHVTLSESMRIRFCPFFGKYLDELAASDPTLYATLAKEHQPYQNEWGM